jgi:hypothetical protein
MSATTAETVGKPGVGLPPLEAFLARVSIAVLRRTTSRAAALSRFRAEADRLAALIGQLDETAARTRVLVKRVRGIEDNSRYWSAGMVLEHLMIVDHGIAGIIEHICNGEVYPDEVSIRQVKPHPETGNEIVPAFRSAVDDYCRRVQLTPNLHSKLTHVHPWFGGLDGHAWHCLAATHHTIHRRQMERIVQAFAAGQGA